MKMRSILASTVALTAGIAVADQAQAGFVLAGFTSTELIDPVGPTDRANTAPNGNMAIRTQMFNVSGPASLENVSIFAESPTGDSVSLWISDGLGAGSNILYNDTFSVSPDAGGVASWHNFDVSGAMLPDAGQYFVLIGSNGPQGFEIRRTSEEGSVQLGTRAAGVIAPGDPLLGANYFTFEDGQVLAVQITGSIIPAPGSIALAGLSGLILIGRRKR